MKLLAIPAFEDNYLWMFCHGKQAVVVDPGDATPVLEVLQAESLQLNTILVTHHHADHIGGVKQLLQHTPVPVFAPGLDDLDFDHQPLYGGESIEVLGQSVHVMATPGHTLGHLSYHLHPEGESPILFCGDTLFSGGCGRLFEGTPSQMLGSLDAMSALPGDTRVCCAHEYTLSNLRFALAVEPSNLDLQNYLAHCQHLRELGHPTLPSSIDTERRINPFMRVREPEVIQSARQHTPSTNNPDAILASLREWKNQF